MAIAKYATKSITENLITFEMIDEKTKRHKSWEKD